MKVSHSICKYLQLLLRHGGDHVALRSAARLADVHNGTLHGVHAGHFGNVDCVVPSLPKEFEGRRGTGITALFNGFGNLAPIDLVLAAASVADQ